MTQLVNYVLTVESCTPNLKENPHKNLLVGFIQSVKIEKNVIHKNTLTIFRKNQYHYILLLSLFQIQNIYHELRVTFIRTCIR